MVTINGDKYFPRTALLAYFSGTGCTEEVCDCFAKKLSKLNIDTVKINIASSNPSDIGETDLLIILSPVYGFRLSSITEKWVNKLPIVKKTPAVVISVSAGGEVSPNTACRVKCKRILKRRGYNIIYEKMIVMPSNFALQAEERLNIDLIKVLPLKVNKIIQEILSDKKRVSRPKMQDRLFATMGIGEHLGARFFGASIRVSQECNKCNICARSCPQRNIKIVNGIPKFGFRCIWCLKCIYNCPCKALSPRILKFSVLEKGFDMNKMIENAKMDYCSIENTNDKNFLWQGVIDYLRNYD
nr:EFR1 family ferrodoxin [Sedimentibacter sp.]